MLELLLAATVLGTAPAPDTVLDLRRGDRVVLENLSGEIVVRAWDRDQLELSGSDDEISLIVSRSGSTVRVTRDDRKGRRRSVEAMLRLPAWVDLEAGGHSLDLRVRGINGRIEVNTEIGRAHV